MKGIAQTGLFYTKDIYDQERYEHLQQITSELLGSLTDLPQKAIHLMLNEDFGYATPKTDIRAFVQNEQLQILLVQEKTDNTWSLPGGWGDIGYSPKEVAVKEVWEEAGITVEPLRLLAILDKNKHPFPPDVFYTYKFIIACRWTEGALQPGIETSDVNFFSLEEIKRLPLSFERNLFETIELAAGLASDDTKTVYCD